jgi:hypothetical protein
MADTTVAFPDLPDTEPSISGLDAMWEPQPGAVAYRMETEFWTVHVSAGAFPASNVLTIPNLDDVTGWNPSLDVDPTHSGMNLTLELDGSLDDIIRTRPLGPTVIRAVAY